MSGAPLRLFFTKTRKQNRGLAELNEDFDDVVFVKKNHFERKILA